MLSGSLGLKVSHASPLRRIPSIRENLWQTSLWIVKLLYILKAGWKTELSSFKVIIWACPLGIWNEPLATKTKRIKRHKRVASDFSRWKYFDKQVERFQKFYTGKWFDLSYLCKGPLEWEERSYPVRPFNSWPVNLEFNLSIHNYVEVQLIGQMHWQGSSFAER